MKDFYYQSIPKNCSITDTLTIAIDLVYARKRTSEKSFGILPKEFKLCFNPADKLY